MRASINFVRPAYRDPQWRERIEFSCVTSRAHVRAHFAIDFYTNLDVADARVIVESGSGNELSDIEFTDFRSHLPIDGSRLAAVKLSNGLTILGAPALSVYELSYESVCGRVQAKLEFTARADAIDDSFTTIAGDDSAPASVTPDNMATPGRIDQPMHVKGELRIDDSFFTVDCATNRVHVWGSAPAEPTASAGTDELHFGEELSITVESAEIREGWPSVRHAYVVRKNEVRRVTSATVVYQDTDDDLVRYEVTDETGETYRVAGKVVATTQLGSGENGLAHLRRITVNWNGRSGTGHSVWVSDIREIQRRHRVLRRPTRLSGQEKNDE